MSPSPTTPPKAATMPNTPPTPPATIQNPYQQNLQQPQLQQQQQRHRLYSASTQKRPSYISSFIRWLQLKKYQYEVTFSLYMLTSTEKIIFNLILGTLFLLLIAAATMYLPNHVTLIYNRIWYYVHGEFAFRNGSGNGSNNNNNNNANHLAAGVGAVTSKMKDKLLSTMTGTGTGTGSSTLSQTRRMLAETVKEL